MLGLRVMSKSGSSSRTVMEDVESPGADLRLGVDTDLPINSSWSKSCWLLWTLDVSSAVCVCRIDPKSSTVPPTCEISGGGGTDLGCVEGCVRALRLRTFVDGSHCLPRR